MPIPPNLVAAAVAAAIAAIATWGGKRGQQADPGPHRNAREGPAGGPGPLQGGAGERQCIKIALMVWCRASRLEAHDLINTLLRKDGEFLGKNGQLEATEPQVRAIASLIWFRASKQQAHDLILALERMPARPRKPLRRDLHELFGQRF